MKKKIAIKTSLHGQKKQIILFAMGGLCVYYAIFFFIPLFIGLVGSLQNWNPLTGIREFIGLENYLKIFKSDIFKTTLGNSIYFTFVAVLFKTVFGLLIAVGLLSLTKSKELIRSLYFLPVIMPIVAIALVWKWIYHPRIGLLNFILLAFGIHGPNWLGSPGLAMPSVLAMVVWKDVGYAIVIFIAGLLNIPKMYYDAAHIDGASSTQSFRYITIPLLKPTTIFVVITSLISYFQSFMQVYIMTQGGPGNSTNLLSYFIFHEAFVKYRFGYASAISVILFMIIIFITIIQFKIMDAKKL